MTFEELGLAEPLLRAVVSQGYRAPTPIQSQAIPRVMAGNDLLGCAQTGTGKTAAFALPVLHRLLQSKSAKGRQRPAIRVLVLAPTRELAVQIGESFHVYGGHTGLRSTVIYGGVAQGSQTRALQRGVDILVATPGRLLDLMDQGYVDLRAVEIFVLDEADRMLDMGFLPDVRRIISAIPPRRQTLLFSATMPEAIARLADAILVEPAQVRIAPAKATTELIDQAVYHVPRQQKPRLLARFLSEGSVTRALVFTRTKRGADRVVQQLSRAGIRADSIHGNKSQSARQRTLEDFRSSRTAVLVATDIAARGIDVEGISHVVNYDLPHEPETYVHRIGRTGRAGASGRAISFCDHEERKLLVAIERLIRRAIPIEGESAESTESAPEPPRPERQEHRPPRAASRERGKPARKPAKSFANAGAGPATAVQAPAKPAHGSARRTKRKIRTAL